MRLIPLGILASSGKAIYAGYIAGGAATSLGATSTIDKFDFLTNLRTVLSPGLPGASSGMSGVSNSKVAGYMARGADGSNYSSTVYKYIFVSDLQSTLATGLAFARSGGAGVSNSGVAGYFGGGGDSNASTAAVEKYTFSNDSRSILSSSLSTNRAGGAGMSNSGVAGYFAGGITYTAGVNFRNDLVDKYNFSNDSRSTLGTGLSSQISDVGSMSNSGVAGYTVGGTRFVNGIGFVYVNTIDKFSFVNDSRSTLGTGLSYGAAGPSGVSDTSVAGYVFGGYDQNTVGYISTGNKFSFPSDTRSIMGTGLSQARAYSGTMSNSENL